MNTRQRFLATVTLMLSITTAMMAQMMPPIPVDPDVKIGKLANGLTYYIRHNEWPEHRAEFFIAQRVGSIQEEDDQRGLAHFLEHMCFNGTDNFPSNNVVRYCESIGVQFGRDLNAYTGIDQTVYNISNVPTDRQSALDSCLLILHDWADGLLLEPEEIDKERGVIHEEWRMRTSAAMRMFERSLPKLYPGSKYGHRFPIGLMSVVDNFKPQTLRDYYEKWYRPDNQAIIVVGDVDVAHVEAEIQRLFGNIIMPENATPVSTYPVPDNAEAIVVVDKDKEMSINEVELIFKHEAYPEAEKNNIQYLMVNYLIGAATTMLNNRIGEAAKKADCPFLQAGASYGQFLFSKSLEAFDLSAVPKDGQTEEALKAVLIEARRAAEFGFTATEYKRYTADYLSTLEKNYSNKDKRYNVQFANQYKNHFLSNEPIPSIDITYQMMKQVVPNIPVEAVNELMKQMVLNNDSNVIIINFNAEKEGATYPTEQSLLKALHDGRAEAVTPYIDNVKDEPLMASTPKPGKIVNETVNATFGYKELKLSNGATVILKPTDFKKDQVLLRGEGFGGYSLYGADDFDNIDMFDDAIAASGLGNFSSTELEKALAGKIASARLTIGDSRTHVSGSATPTDVETLLQLVYLNFTAINKDQESFDNMMKTTELELKNKAQSPESAFSDSVKVTLSNYNPRMVPMTVERLAAVSYDRILQIAREQTCNAAAFTFTIIGNYDEARLLPLIETYLASLPSTNNIVKGHDIQTPIKGVLVNSFRRKMETPKAMAVMAWITEEIPYSLENSIRASMAGQVLMMMATKEIREEAGVAYSPIAQAGCTRDDYKSQSAIIAMNELRPEKADTALLMMRDEVERLARSCDSDMLTKVKEYMLKQHGDDVKTNGYWAGIIAAFRQWGIDMHTDYEQTVKAQTPETISRFVAEVLSSGNRAEVIMQTENKE